MIVNPAEGALVRDPLTKRAIEDGTDVDPYDPYWARALADGDVAAAPAAIAASDAAVPPSRRSAGTSNEDAN